MKLRTIQIISLLLGVLLWETCSADLSRFQHLREPKIQEKPAQKMLVVRLKGDPNETAGKAFSALYKVYYQLDDPDEGVDVDAPRARWPVTLDTPRNEWVGLFALPVSANIMKLSAEASELEPPVELVEWQYGTVADMLHTGSYSTETPTINKLRQFIQGVNYQIVGEHEEVYLKGPGMFFKGDENEYQTIIRYRVSK